MRHLRRWLGGFEGHPYRYFVFLLVTLLIFGVGLSFIVGGPLNIVGAVLIAAFGAFTKSKWAAEREKQVPKGWQPPQKPK